MKRLTLLRHAEAGKGARDFERPLTEKGRRDAARMGAAMAELRLAPDLVLSSPSARTRQTLEHVAPHLKDRARAEFPDALYNASPSAILSEIWAAPESAAHILVIGHNPGLHALSLSLVDHARSDAAAIVETARRFPPGALAHFEFAAAEWTAADERLGVLLHFAAPED
ncbi:MAG: histidine phosphatase family protein [Pseudomonadota bacterium]|nr:histidine phosphatase family protein [Pseudomonadota bacterium]